MPQPPTAQNPRPTIVRHLVVVLLSAMSILLYLDRFCVSFAERLIKEDLNLTNTQMSWFLSAFFFTYALAQVPSGWMTDRYGARVMLTIYILGWSLFTAMIGFAGGLVFLLLARAGCGLGQSGAYPTGGSVLSKWIPFSNRGTASSFVALGGRAGGMIAPVLTGYLIVAFVPLTVDSKLQSSNILKPRQLATSLVEAAAPVETVDEEIQDGKHVADELLSAKLHVWETLSTDARNAFREVATEKNTTPADAVESLVGAVNQLIADPDFYEADAFTAISLPQEGKKLLKQRETKPLSTEQSARLNRLALETVFPDEIGKIYVAGWRPVMIVYGAAGIFVAALFWLAFRDRPERHPLANDTECRMIGLGRPASALNPHGKAGAVPLRRLICSASMWYNSVSQLGTNIGWVFIVTWFPRYLKEVHHVPLVERGWMAGLPLMFGMGGMLLGGFLTDWLTQRFGLKWGRRLPWGGPKLIGCAAFLACTQVDNPWPATAALCVVSFCTDIGGASVWAFTQDVGGRYAGSVLGWGNMWGNLGATISPILLNIVIENAGWDEMFLVCAAGFLIAGVAPFGVDPTIPIPLPEEDEGPSVVAN